ncbi:RmlC-like cupin domain-containing protein [Cristinia sonorae]|uniref:RmlC-like cupin domain-containing protein n=1 Tax=Cristinia sonorae TaxID=1940300 RepID=A0A8K0UT18_9AGAR|nr:RmlC-like cupin domain-containing protein [Cristinia sonorae]
MILSPTTGTGTVHGVFRSDEFPVHNDADVRAKGEWTDTVVKHGTLVANEGAVSRVYDLAPGTIVPFHRTHSLDIGVVLKGSLTLELENHETVILKEGDTIVQRGTWHEWRNQSDGWTRIMFVLLAAHPIEVNGNVLPTTAA